MEDAVIIDAVRTAGGKRNGKLKDWHPAALAAHVLKSLEERNSLNPESIDDVIMGCVMQVGEQSLNIGRNAVQALDGKPGAAITLTAQVLDGETIIDMADNGPGLPDAVRKNLFEPFSNSGRSGGTGLGLAIARELIRAQVAATVQDPSEAADKLRHLIAIVSRG